MTAVKSLFLAIAMATASTGAIAGPYSNDLTKCLIESTSQQDRMALVQWVFAAASLHPAVKSIARVSEKQLDDANKSTAELFMRLLTDSCKTETEKALKYEGRDMLRVSFQVLGQVAGKEIFASPEVAVAMSGFAKHLDKEKLQALFKVQKK